MIEQITEEELEFCECFYNPVCLIETVFTNLKNLAKFDEDKFSEVRLYQLPNISYEYLIDYDGLSKQEALKLREGSGTIYNFGGRTTGKTLQTEKIDMLVSMMLLDDDKEGMTSFDALHIIGVLEDVIAACDNHPLLSLFGVKSKRSPNYQLRAKNGWFLESVNMNITAKNEGKAFHQKHFDKLFLEEASYETDNVYKKRAESTQEGGRQVIRSSGMTNFTKHLPAGKVYYDLKMKPWIMNLPSYVSPEWTEESKKKAIEKHGGEHTSSYKIFIEGEIVEAGWNVFDMMRVRENCYDDRKNIKHFEIDKDNFYEFERLIVVERPINAESVFVVADVGETTGATEIIILFEINNKYRYEYNVTLHNLTDKEQEKIFDFIIEKVKANVISVDCGDGLGRVIYRYLEERYGKEHLVYYAGAKKIKVGFEKDDNDNIIFKNGEPLYREEFMSEWSVQRLKQLLYEAKIIIPLDIKFDIQFNSVKAVQSGNRTIYDSTAEEDHLFSAFRVFSIAQWDKEWQNIRPVVKKKWYKSGV